MPKRKAPQTPGRGQNKRLRDPNTGRFLPCQVAEPINNGPSQSPQPEAQGANEAVDSPRTQLTALEQFQSAAPAQTPERESSPPKDSPSPGSEFVPVEDALIWSLINPKGGFWNAVRQSAQDQGDYSKTSSGDEDLNAVMRDVNNSVNYHIQSRGIEDQGYLSSSPHTPTTDARGIVPVTPRDEQEQQVMMWPTVQHVVELIPVKVWQPDPLESYLSNLKMVRDQFDVAWQAKERPGPAPQIFHLESWHGSIVDWRYGFYTNGRERYAVADVAAVLETWFDKKFPDGEFVPEAPTPGVTYPRSPLGDITAHFHEATLTTPYVDRSYLRPARGSAEDLAERFGDNGSPAPITEADRRRAEFHALVPDLTRGNRTLVFPGTGETFSDLNDQRPKTPPDVPDIWWDEDARTPPGVDEPSYTPGSQDSNKENDDRLWLQPVEDARNERIREEAEQAAIEQAEADEEERVARESSSEARRRRWEELYGPGHAI
ncbi:MAG: hypothetical protein Q9174_006994 [Haloplaca sp. 1 TL-2023]